MERTKAIVFRCYVNGLGIIRSLGRRGIPVIAVDYHRNALGFSSKYACESIIAPDPRVDEHKFLAFILENSDRWAGSVLIPTHDEELAIFSYHKEELAKHYILPVADWEAIKNIVDKKGTYEIAAGLDIPIPKTIYLDSVGSLDSLKNDVDYPCLLKPRRGHEFNHKFGFKAFVIEDYEQLKMRIAQMRQVGCEMMIQEFISGKDDEIYVYIAYYNSESKPLAEFTQRKLRQNPPTLGVGRVAKSTHTEEIVAPSRQILGELSYYGLCAIEYKKDAKDSKFKLLDINGRSHMQIGLPTKCGLDFPWVMYNDLIWQKELPMSEYKDGVEWIHASRDIPPAV
ncbi:MAG: carboxylate--amine ligase, partial [Candidatus Thorarchaeota archaeon]